MADDPTREDYVPRIETRSASIENLDAPQRIVTVVAAPYGQPTKVMYRNEVWNEVFNRSAFVGLDPKMRRIPVTACLKVPDVNHGDGHLCGRVLEAYTDRDEGLIADIKLSRTDTGQETLELIKEDNLSVSVGFMVKNPYMDEVLDRQTRTRQINRAFLDHLAFVVQPAYPGAKVLAYRSDGVPEADFPVADRPLIEEFLNDPLLQWANERTNRD